MIIAFDFKEKKPSTCAGATLHFEFFRIIHDEFCSIFGIFEPHMHHETIGYLPISLQIHKICLRVTIEVYLKHDYCFRFQRKKARKMRRGHPALLNFLITWYMIIAFNLKEKKPRTFAGATLHFEFFLLHLFLFLWFCWIYGPVVVVLVVVVVLLLCLVWSKVCSVFIKRDIQKMSLGEYTTYLSFTLFL